MQIQITMTEAEAHTYFAWRWNLDKNTTNSTAAVVPDLAPAVASDPDPVPCDMGGDSYDIDGGLEDAVHMSQDDNMEHMILAPDGLNLQSPDGNKQTYVGPVPGIERDRRGLPWDGRIHASSRARVADGTWRMRRGVDDMVIKKVEAELKAAWGSSPLPVTPEPIVEVLPPAPPVVEVLPPAPPVNPDDVKNLIMEVTRRGLSPEVVSDACNKAVIPGLPGLSNRPEMARPVAMILGVTI